MKSLDPTEDVIGQLARLVQVNNMSDKEVEDVVSSLASVQFMSKFNILNIAIKRLYYKYSRRLVSHTGLLKQVGLDIPSSHPAHVVEPDTDELPESGGVVVPHRLGVAVGLQHGVGLHHLVLKGGLLLFTLLWLLSWNKCVI